MTADYGLGFRSVDVEHRDQPLDVDGTVPAWLDGCLIRNGPGRFDVGGERVAHWFDGLAMLTRFGFDEGAVAYTNRFLRSEEYRSVTEQGQLAGGQFGTVGGGLLARVRNWLLPATTDNANVNVLRVGDRFVAVTETQLGIAFDPRTLETRGQYPFDSLNGQTMTAHPHVDHRRGETVTLATDYGRTSRYRVYRLSHGEERFQPVGSVATDRPAYVHSFGLTADHVVIAAFPFDVHPLRLLRPGRAPFIERFDWRPEVGTRFVVLDRTTGDVVAERVTEACFAFHHVNAFEDGDELVVDLAAFEGPGVIDSLRLAALADGAPPQLDGDLRRYRLPLAGGGVDRETLYDPGLTLPRIAPSRDTQPYRYVYGQGTPDADADRPQRLVKVDVREGGAVEWVEPGTFCGEPVFVPRPDGDAEDDGVVLAVVLETDAERSALLVLDGASFEAIARAPLPHVVPFDFHGQFFAGR